MAAVEATHSRPDAARGHLDEALQANRKCVRASMLLGDLAAAAGRHDEAVEHWKRVETQNPAFLALVAHRLLKSFQALGDTATGLTLLRGYLAQYPSLDLLDVVFQSTLDAEGPDAAYALVRDELRRNPTLLGLDRLLEAQLLAAPAGAAPRPRAGAQPRAGPDAAALALQVRELRVPGAAVLLAVPGVPRLGDLPAAADRGVRSCAVTCDVSP